MNNVLTEAEYLRTSVLEDRNLEKKNYVDQVYFSFLILRYFPPGLLTTGSTNFGFR